MSKNDCADYSERTVHYLVKKALALGGFLSLKIVATKWTAGESDDLCCWNGL